MDPASAQRPPDSDAAQAPTRAADGDWHPAPSEKEPAGRHRRRRWAAAGAIVLVAVAAAAVMLFESGSSSHSTSATGVPAGETTTTVERRTLTESATVDGTLGYGATVEIYDRLAGTYTWLPSTGAVIGRGGTLFRIDNEPIVLMYGSLPAYRTLALGVSDGPDVRELNENLIDLGYDPYGAIAEVERFSEATEAAVRRWQKAEGLSETGEVELGRVVFEPSARRVTAVHVVLGQDPKGATGSKEPAAKEPAAKTPAAKKPAAKEPEAKAPAAKEPEAKEPDAKEPAAKGEEEPAAKGEEEPAAGGGEAVLSTTSTQQLVQLKVKAEQQQLAHVGASVPVTLPGGRDVEGRIIEVGSVASEGKGSEGEKGAPGSESGESATIPVTIALEHPVAHLDEAPVSVELVKAVSHEVLTVPATALSATAGHGYAIEVLEDGRRFALAVTPGMFADGYVEVEGAGLREGMTVIEAE